MTLIVWTGWRIAELRRRHAAGEIWQVIADAIGLHERTARNKGRQLGLYRRRRLADSRVWAGKVWTDALDAIVTAGYAASKSVATIQAEIGSDCTRNMVIGRANRLGLPPHANARGGAGMPKFRKPAPDTRHLRMVPVVRPTFGVLGNTVAAVMARRRDQCLWIDGDPRTGIAFCQNDARNGISYCEAHRVAGTQPKSALTADDKKHLTFIGNRGIKTVARR